ncbi:MAG: transcription-repair coupling factor [Clostridia bacterium]|nr:transcription-repair coupling factor [Clostridia bacterium]
MKLNEVLNENKSFCEIKSLINNNSFPVSVTDVCEAAQGNLISAIQGINNKKSLVVCYTDTEAAELYKELLFYSDNVTRFPSRELVFYDIDAVGLESEHRRIRALSNWENGGIMVTSVEAVMHYTVSYEHFINNRIELKVGETWDIGELKEKLVQMGYVNSLEVDGVGLFSARGGIVDIYSPNMKLPVRVEFFDDEIDSIRVFDWETQRSVENVNSALVIVAREQVMNDTERNRLVNRLSELSARFPENDKLKSELEKAENGILFPSVDKYIKAVFGKIPTVMDYADDAMCFVVDSERIKERFENFVHDKAETLAQMAEAGIIINGGDDFYPSGEEIYNKLINGQSVLVSAIGKGISVKARQVVSFHGKLEYLYDDLSKWQSAGYTVVIFVQNSDKVKNLEGVLKDKGYSCVTSKDNDIKKSTVNIIPGFLKNGFEYPESKFVLISDREIFEKSKTRRAAKDDNSKRIKSYNDINPGDYVVHRAHGIGMYDGIHKMTVGGISKDYLKVVYRDNDILYVPVEQLDLLYKYSGGEEKAVRVNKLGGKEWSNTKSRVKKSTAEMAKKLVALYAEREKTKGFAFSKDTVWQRDFEDAFVYTETDDQLRSIEEVKADMEKDRPMDRLLCGDVGFGKTEVALRAAFKAVMDGKQVAYLCPTTILAMQHFATFTERMSDFPIRVEMLSRFRTKSQQDKILKKLRTGEIDIIIGTHRLLQNDLEFSDLGLLIIDEEQRFGVAHKEKLKELKKNIDVLSMTATPIPRTLHMSMISVRDMSVLTQAPQNRYPVQTYVLEDDSSVIADAIRLEMSRGGQVFYLYNRVQGIYKKADEIQKMFPDKVVRVGHGKMDETQLEDVMHGMVVGDTDILVCTTIIETGLDIPNANTIIIENADKMGLAQLYQLRGRVGRSNKKAYAYLTYKRNKEMSETARKRLQAIKEFTEFGSGFKIALKDLEIRGAGDLLGAQQHGHMDSVGYDLYCRILRESVNEATGVETEEEIETSIDVSVDAYIPERYISAAAQRIEMYKKISHIENEDDEFEIEDEMIDRFGDIPRAAQNVILVALLKAKAKTAGISDISQKGEYLNITFAKADIPVLIGLVKGEPLKYKLIPGEIPKLRMKLTSPDRVLKEADSFVGMLLK